MDLREIDKLVWAHIFGWKEHTAYSPTRYYTEGMHPQAQTKGEEDIPHYSSLIADAWLVIEELRKEKFNITIFSSADSDYSIRIDGLKACGAAIDVNLARGICLSALRAKGVEI